MSGLAISFTLTFKVRFELIFGIIVYKMILASCNIV